jgi:hypothetical protein
VATVTEDLPTGYEIVLKVPAERLPLVQAELDTLLQKHDLEVHIRHR